MYYVLTYKKNFLGIFTTFLNAKRYIDKNFEFDFIDEYENKASVQEVMEYYNDWKIRKVVSVYTLENLDVNSHIDSINDIIKVDYLYIVDRQLVRRSRRNRRYCPKKIIKITHEKIRMIENTILAEISIDINILITQINIEKSDHGDR